MTTTKVTAKKAASYTSANIKTLVFPESVRRNASQYIGGTDSYGLWMIIKELLDNGLDEALAGRNTKVGLFLDSDGSFWVSDAGHGVPQGITKTKIHVNGKDIINKMPTMQAVFGALNTSGKYDTTAYEVSIGTHGIGSKGTNATCEYFTVWTFFEGQWYTVAFKKGVLQGAPAKCKAPRGPEGLMKSGTLIHCKPDMTIFSSSKFPTHMAIEWAEMMAYFNPGVEIKIKSSKNEKVFLSKEGVKEYIELRLKKLKTEAEKVFFEYRAPHGDLNAADVVIAFSEYVDCDLRGFTNGSFNSKGGKHVDSVTGALYAGLKPYIKTKKVDGKIVPLFREGDLKEGLVGIVNAKLHKAKFNSQDKVFLSDERMGKEFEDKLTVVALKFFKENKALAGRLCERAIKINELKSKFTMSKAMVTALNKMKREGMPANYAAADARTKVEDRELFIVEGDSAAGGIRKTKRPWQSLLPLTGKIMNVIRPSKEDKAMASKAVLKVLGAIGYDPKAVDAVKKLNVGRIICFGDPDADGPFVGETQIRYRWDANYKVDGDSALEPEWIESTASIQGLAESPARAQANMYVPVWIGGAVQWKPATARLEKNVDTLVALEIGGHKYKVDLGHKFMVVRTPAVRDRITQVYSDDLAYIRAEDMRIGDRVYAPQNEADRKAKNLIDRMTGKGFLAVNKLRIQHLDEPVPVYCLTVPRHHNFMLPSGLVSSNCHINSLLLGLIYKLIPELFNQGKVFIADIPEFYTVYKDQLFTGDTLSEVQKQLKVAKAPANTSVNHIKGWGEVNADLIELLAVDSRSRRLIQIKALENKDSIDFVRLMNEDVQYRKDLFGLPGARSKEEQEVSEAALARKVAVKKTVKKKVSASVRNGGVDKKNKSRLGPISDAISEVAARKRSPKPTLRKAT
jgi:DNA gyrase/topoisomerase IV subunit B